MTRILYISFIVILVFISETGKTQVVDLKLSQRYEPVYSQYWINGLAINPAYSGSRECFSNTILYRNQWIGFKGTPVTQTLSSHAPLKNEKNALGLFLFHETIGVEDFIDIYGNYAFRFQLGEGKLSLGLKAGVTLFQGDYSSIKANPDAVANDPVLKNESSVLPNFGVGAYYYTDKFFVGFSVPKFLSYKIKNSKKVMDIAPSNYDFLLTGGYLFAISDLIKVKPSFLFRYRLDNTYQVDLGGNVILYDMFWLGASYRKNDEIAFMVEYQINDQIRTGVSYDVPIGDLSSKHKGSLEIILRYDFKYKIRAVNPRYF